MNFIEEAALAMQAGVGRQRRRRALEEGQSERDWVVEIGEGGPAFEASPRKARTEEEDVLGVANYRAVSA